MTTPLFNLGGGFNPEAELEEQAPDIKNKITLRFIKRNNKKGWTIIENFAKLLSSKELIDFRTNCSKNLQCTCSAIDSENKAAGNIKKNKLKNKDLFPNYNNIIIQLQGNNISKIKKILIEKYHYSEDDIIIRG
tara:strand:- start:479 stop:880 length:402 start_codon:yes stop_codon:yes gene_type:complete